MHEVSSTRDRVQPWFLRRVLRAIAVVLALPAIVAGLTGCNGFPNSGASSTGAELSVSPSSITVAAGSITPFTAAFATTPAPARGSLTWSVSTNAGTITKTGTFTASSTAGRYTVIATWTPSDLAHEAIVLGGATVTVLAVPQLNSAISPNQVVASGGNQSGGVIQNGTIAGQGQPSLVSADSSGNVQARSGFPIPIVCAGSSAVCQ